LRTPHTHYAKGKTVWIKLRDGSTLTGKFVERKGKFVVLDNAKVLTNQIRAMTFRKLTQTA
jgi:small nuclear ribonucleoprotein (snRNP)-like protein